MTKVFISYRRDDSKVIAGRIYDYLTPPLGTLEPRDVFKDVDSIPPGVNFKKHLEKHVAQCAVALVIIGPSWLNIKDADGLRRLDDEADFVRVEIESALKREIPVIPLLVMGAQMPKSSQLPATLAPLAFQHGLSVRDDPDFRNDMMRLKKSLEHWINPIVVTEPGISKISVSITPAIGTCRKDKYGIEMIYVPAGKFLMGSTKDEIERAFRQMNGRQNESLYHDFLKNESPQHSIRVSKGFWIDRVPVTNAAYQKFLKVNGYKIERYWTQAGWDWLSAQKANHIPVNYEGRDLPNQPRVGITWYEAMAYATWRNARLPNEAEWEYTARGRDAHIYPWGDRFDYKKAVYIVDKKYRQIAPVGSNLEGQSWIGVLDMIGYISEWTTTIYDPENFPYPFNEDGRDSIIGQKKRVLRGSSANYALDFMRTAYRSSREPDREDIHTGFRCVRDVLP